MSSPAYKSWISFERANSTVESTGTNKESLVYKGYLLTSLQIYTWEEIPCSQISYTLSNPPSPKFCSPFVALEMLLGFSRW